LLPFSPGKIYLYKFWCFGNLIVLHVFEGALLVLLVHSFFLQEAYNSKYNHNPFLISIAEEWVAWYVGVIGL